MAKNKKSEFEAPAMEAPAMEAPAMEAPAMEAPAMEAKTLSAFEVSVDCPTPLEFNPAVINAADESQAWQRFCLKNGISGTDHSKTITPLV